MSTDYKTHQYLMITKLYNKRITVPEEIREALELKDGDRLLWVETDGKFYLQKAEYKEEKNKIPFNF